MTYSMDDVNRMSREAFVSAFGAVFEETPAIAHRAWEACPFADVAHLHQQMMAVVNGMDRDAQLTLIRAHPDLGSRVKMADASVQEQAGAGLDRLNANDFETFQRLNQAYKSKFGFPFIIAVKHHTKASILEAFNARLTHSPAEEMQQSLSEIAKIARFRLDDLVQ